MKQGYLLTLLLFCASIFYSKTLWAAQTIDMVRIEQGEYAADVIYQFFDGKRWQAEINVSENSRNQDFTPVIVRFEEDKKMVVWNELTGLEQSVLSYRVLSENSQRSEQGGVWSEKGQINTPTVYNSVPTLSVDSNGQVWCFWSGFDGNDDEIMVSRYASGQWSEARRVDSTDNAVPDILPTSRVNKKGQLKVLWKRFDADKLDYVDAEATLTLEEEALNENELSQKKADETTQWRFSKPKSVIANPFASLAIPSDFVVPPQVTLPPTVALAFSEHPGVAFHLSKR